SADQDGRPLALEPYHLPVKARNGLGTPHDVTINWSLALVAATNSKDRSQSSCSFLAVGSPSTAAIRSGITLLFTPARIITGNSSPLTRCMVASRTPPLVPSLLLSSRTCSMPRLLRSAW